MQDRLNRVVSRSGEWSGATDQQVADARSALRWMREDPDFKEIKYDVDPQTGDVTNYRERDWNYPRGERPKTLSWRDADGNEVTASGKPKKKPSTGPPTDTPQP